MNLTVTLDGAAPAAPVRSIRVATRLGRPAQCEVLLDAGALPALGAALRVTVDGDEPLFDGDLTAIELVRAPDGAASTRLRGYDRLHRLRKRGTPRVFTDMSTVDIIAALTGDLDVKIVDPEDTQHERVVQHGQRDFDLLLELTAAAGRYPQLHADGLHLVTLAGTGDPVPLRLGGTLWQVRVEANLDRAATRYTALAWHPQRAEPLTADASEPRTGRKVRLSAEPKAVGVDGDLTLVNQPASGGSGPAAIAQASLDASTAGAVTVQGVAAGDHRLTAGRRIRVSGVDDTVDGEYVLTEAVHLVDAGGFRTEVSTKPPAEAPRRASTELALGRVTAVDDPDALGRVRVSLPAHGDVDAGWLAVLCPGAGQGRGLVVLPDVDDTVAVALPHGQPAGGIVLGSLYGMVEPHESGVRGGAVRAWSLRSKEGQRVLVDDEERTVRVDNADGSYIELAPQTVRLHAATDLVIEAPGHGITVRASSVDFEHAGGL